MKKIIALTLALLLAISCFAGCAKVEEMKQVAEKTIVVGYTLYPPMNYEDDNGKLIGFDTELATKVFENLGYKVTFKLIDWSTKYVDLEAGTIDCVWNGFTCNTTDDDGVARSEKVDFSYRYMENYQIVVIQKDSDIAAPADLNGKNCAVEGDSAGASYAATLEGVTVKDFPYQTDCILEVKSGTMDFAVVDALLAKSIVGKGNYENLTILEGMPEEVEYYAIGFKRGSDLTAKVNAELEKLAADGTIMELAEKYAVNETVIVDFSDQK